MPSVGIPSSKIAGSHLRRAVGVDRRGAAGEDQRHRVASRDLGRGRLVRHELGVDARLADAPGDQLRVLAAEVEHQDRPLLRERLGPQLDDLSSGGNWVRPW